MGIKERRDIERAEMRKNIMDASIEIIEQEGYEKLSIRKIASKIEYSPTTIYLYYTDKAQIIKDMADMLYSRIMDAAAAAGKNNTLPADTLVYDMLRIFIEELCSEPEMVKAVMYSGENVIFANGSTDGKPSNSGIDMLDAVISAGISEKVFRPGSENTAWMIISALLGFVLSCVANRLYLHDDFGRLADDFVKILLNGIRL